MADYENSSHLNDWLFESEEQLEECRAQANHTARVWLAERSDNSKSNTNNSSSLEEGTTTASTTTSDNKSTLPLPSHHARGFARRKKKQRQQQQSDGVTTTDMNVDYTSQGPWKNSKGHEFLTPTEESTLVAFYASKLATLIGPRAQVSRLKRDSKVTATAALLYRRFFLSNSVHFYDPKAVLVAAAFLASKVEDSMADVRYLQEGTEKMQAPVSTSEIIHAELALLQGCYYDLLCFHPFKSVLALTEDLRTYLKSDKGQSLVNRPISGQDLKPIYDHARLLLEQVVIRGTHDVTLLYSPGPIGLASLMVAQEQVQQQRAPATTPPLEIDFTGYVQQRFSEQKEQQDGLLKNLPALCQRLRDLPDSHAVTTNEELAELKRIHKKLKKTKLWGNDSKKSKKKKDTSSSSRANTPTPILSVKEEEAEEPRPATPTMSNVSVGESGGDAMPPPAKRVKLENEEEEVQQVTLQ